MTTSSNRFHRRSIRMPNYDYAQAGAYFVTLCTQKRECVLDDPIVAGIILDVWESLPTRFPTIALDEFVVMPNHVHFIVWLQLHSGQPHSGQPHSGQPHSGQPHSGQPQGLPLRQRDVGAGFAPALERIAASYCATADRTWIIPAHSTSYVKPSLGDVVGAWKSLVFTIYLDWIESKNLDRQAKFWQRNYYEHVVRNERELVAIRRYIRDNPANWDMDRDNVAGGSGLGVPTHVRDYLTDAHIA